MDGQESGAWRQARRGGAAWRWTILLAGATLAGAVLLAWRAGWLAPTLMVQLGAGRPGAAGAALFVLAGAAACAVGLPRQAVAFAGGLGFGTWAGLALSMLAQMLGCAANLAWARAVGQDWVRAYLQRRRHGRLGRLDQFLAANPFIATLTLRLLPVGNNLLLNLLAGASSVPVRPFLAASGLGFLPQSLVFALLGGGARVGRGTELAVGAALFAASAALGLVLLRRSRRAALLAEAVGR